MFPEVGAEVGAEARAEVGAEVGAEAGGANEEENITTIGFPAQLLTSMVDSAVGATRDSRVQDGTMIEATTMSISTKLSVIPGS